MMPGTDDIDGRAAVDERDSEFGRERPPGGADDQDWSTFRGAHQFSLLHARLRSTAIERLELRSVDAHKQSLLRRMPLNQETPEKVHVYSDTPTWRARSNTHEWNSFAGVFERENFAGLHQISGMQAQIDDDIL
jgi:hypothetical protein